MLQVSGQPPWGDLEDHLVFEPVPRLLEETGVVVRYGHPIRPLCDWVEQHALMICLASEEKNRLQTLPLHGQHLQLL